MDFYKKIIHKEISLSFYLVIKNKNKMKRHKKINKKTSLKLRVIQLFEKRIVPYYGVLYCIFDCKENRRSDLPGGFII